MYLDDEEEQRLCEAARRVLSEHGPMKARKLGKVLAGQGYAWAGGAQTLEDLLIEEEIVVDLPDGRLVLMESICEGLTLTHRLTSEEAGDEMVAMEPDLAPLLITEKDTFRTARGEVRVLYPCDGDPAVDEDHRLWEDCALVGPPGWLSGASGGDLMVFRLSGDALSVAPYRGPFADATEAAARLADAFEQYTEDGEPVEADVVVTAAVADAPDLFRAPLPPLGELYELVGLEGCDEWVGEAGHDWDLTWDLPEWDVPLLDPSISEALGLDEISAEALTIVLSTYGSLGREPEGLDQLAAAGEDALPGLALMLSLPAVVDLFLTSVLAEDPDEEPRVAAFARAIAAGAREPGPHYLLACCAEQRHDVAAAEAHLRDALDIDAEFPHALIDAAWYASDRGDAKVALTYLRRVGLPPDHALVAQMERFASPGTAGVGRNDRCPCGSGRKYKVCCVQRNGHPLQDRARWLHQKAGQFLMRVPQRDVVLDVAAARAGADTDEETWTHLALEDSFVQDLALFDSEVFAEFLDVRGALLPADELELGRSWVGICRSLYEVASVHHGGLELRDLRTGDLIGVADQVVREQVSAGQFLYARVVPDGRSHQVLAGAAEVPPELRDQLLAFLDTDPGPEEAAAWLTTIEAQPSLANG